MPRTIAHYIFAMDCLERLEDNNLKNILLNNMDIYSLGCQGPNFFNYCNSFLLHRNKNLYMISDLIHSKNINLFFKNMIYYSIDNNCIKSIFDNEDFFSITFSYLCGFLSHYILDRNMHPYIYSLQFSLKDQYYKNLRELHKSIETHIDTLLLNKLKNMHTFDFKDYLDVKLKREELIIICDMYTFLISNILKKSIIYDDVSNCISMFYKTEKVLNNPQSLYSNQFLFIKNKLSKTSHITSKIYRNHQYCVNDLLNEKKSYWINPFTNEKQKYSLLDIYYYSIDDYSNIIKLLKLFLDNKITLNSLLLEIDNKSFFTNEDFKLSYSFKLY